MFRAIKLTMTAIKRDFIYKGYEKAFGGTESWSFGNNFARNVVIFVVFEQNYDINDSAGVSEKVLVLIFLNQIQSFVQVRIKMLMKVVSLLVKQRYINLRALMI